MAILAQGTEIFFMDPDDYNTPSTVKLVQIACPKTIDPGTPSTDEHDTTNLCSIAKEKFLGLTDYGTISIEIAYDESDESHWRLVELSEEIPRPVIKFVIGLPSENSPLPAITGTNKDEWDLDDERGWRPFDGQVMSVAMAYNAGEVVSATVEISVTKRYKSVRADQV